MNLVVTLRWFLALLSAPFGFYLALYVGIFADGFAASFCPPERVVSGLCTTTWYRWAGDAVVILGAALAAVLVVLLPTLLAPTKRLEVAVTFYSLGAGAAFLMVSGSRNVDLESLLPVFAALIAGAVSVLLIRRFLTERTTYASEKPTRRSA